VSRDVTDAGGLSGGTVVPIRGARGRASLRWEFASAWDFDDPLGSKPPMPDWILTRREEDGSKRGMMRAGKVGLLAGEGGAGKTSLLCGLALSVATGHDWLDAYQVPKAGAVVIALGEEDREEMHRRLHYASRQLGLSREERDVATSRILALPLAGISCALVENDAESNMREADFLAEMRDRLGAIGVEWRLVIVDPLSRFAGLDAESSNAAATRFVQALETLTQLPGRPAVLCAHHTTKNSRRDGRNDQTTVRGASALVDGARWVASLTNVADTTEHARFAIHKSNYAGRPEPLLLTREWGGALRRATLAEEAELDDGS